MTDSVTLSREDLEALIDARVAQASRRGTADPRRGTAESDDPIMAEAANAQRRSFPDPPKVQMEQLAKMRGGLWSADNPDWRKYGGMVQGRDGQLRPVEKCPHAKPKQCDQCWTPETEARWAFAVGLSTTPGIPLDDEESFGSQYASVENRASHDKRHGNPRSRRAN